MRLGRDIVCVAVIAGNVGHGAHQPSAVAGAVAFGATAIPATCGRNAADGGRRLSRWSSPQRQPPCARAAVSA